MNKGTQNMLIQCFEVRSACFTATLLISTGTPLKINVTQLNLMK